MFSCRAFAGEKDLQRMAALALAQPAGNLHVADLPYRLSSWAFDTPENTALWHDDQGRLAGWAVLQPPFWSLDCAMDPEAEQAGLYRQVLAWAEETSLRLVGLPNGRPVWFANVFSDQARRIQQLEAAGFADQAAVGEDSWAKVLLARPLDDKPLPETQLPDGFCLRVLRGAEDVPAYVDLHREVFGTPNMTVEWRARSLTRPEYHPELDLVIEAPGGGLAGFCIGWLAAQTQAGLPGGQIEPMGVKEEYRQKGLGKALLFEQFRRMRKAGAEIVLVETDRERDLALSLYGSVGFRAWRDVLVFRKAYD